MSDEIVDVITTIAGQAELPPLAEQALAEALVPRTRRAGETLFEVGAPADGMVAVARGRLGVVDADDDVIATLGRAELVGEMGALTGRPRSSTVVALRDTTVLEIDQRAFDDLFDSSPVLGRALSRLVIDRLDGEATRAQQWAVPRVVAVVGVGEPGDLDPLIAALTRRVGSAEVVAPSSCCWPANSLPVGWPAPIRGRTCVFATPTWSSSRWPPAEDRAAGSGHWGIVSANCGPRSSWP